MCVSRKFCGVTFRLKMLTLVACVVGPEDSISNKKEYVDLATLKNGCYFSTRKLSTLATEYTETTAAYKSKQGKLVGEIVAIVGKYISSAYRDLID
jgi:DNA mismatch repair ATPase MutS